MIVIFFQNAQRCVTFRTFIVDGVIPFRSGLKYKMFEVLGRFPPRDPFLDKPGDIFGPYWEDIEYDIAFVKRESGISGIEYSE